MQEVTASKSEFGRICNVSPSTVSDWIRHKKIYGDAIVGKGRNARIHVAIAQAQVLAHTDPGQRLGNGLGTRLDGSRSEGSDEVDITEAAELDLDLKREKLAQIERINRIAAADEAAQQGRYVEAAAARREMALIATRMIRMFEGAIPEIASTVAAKCGAADRDVIQALQEAFHRVRVDGAARAQAVADALPKLVAPSTTE